MHDCLIAKNAAADIVIQLYESVVSKLEGEMTGAFSVVTSTNKQALQESADSSGTASHRHALEYHGRVRLPAPLCSHLLWWC